MSNRQPSASRQSWLRSSALACLALAVAGCSGSGMTRMSSTNFLDPVTTGSVTPQATIPNGTVQAPQQVYNQPVYNQPVAAPAPVYSQPTYAQPAPVTAPQPVYVPQQTYTPAAAARLNDQAPQPVQQPIVTAARSTPDTGSSVVVQPGETAYRIATRNGISVNDLMTANGISDPSKLRSGQRLVIPGRGGSAIQTASTSRPSVPAVQSVRHTVVQGDTLYNIGRRHGVSPDRIAQANGISNNQIRLGQSLIVPGGKSSIAANTVAPQKTEPVRTASLSTATPVARVAPPKNSPQAYQPPAVKPREQQVAALPAQSTPVAPAPAAQTASNQAENTSGRFRWPAKGRVVENFGKKSGGGQNDGIKISLPAGTPIRAAEAGVVAYAGDELKGYGNLILIRHNDDWVTAYAHAQDMNVKRGDRVSRGQVIGTVGKTGAVSKPQLHFEVRKGSQPVDPMRHLASL